VIHTVPLEYIIPGGVETLPTILRRIYVLYLLLDRNVDIKFSTHDAFLEKPSSGQSQYVWKPNNSKVFRSKKTKGHTRVSAMVLYMNQLWSPIPEPAMVTYTWISYGHLYLNQLWSPIPESAKVTYTWISYCHLYLNQLRSPIPESAMVTYTWIS
jgi:hypothetical protein